MLFDLIYRYGSFDAYFIPNALTGKTRRPQSIPANYIKISIMSFPSIARLLLNTKKGFQQKPKALNYQWWTIEELNWPLPCQEAFYL